MERKDCPVCGRNSNFIKTNNPMIPSMCENCILDALNPENLEDADFFCRTANFPFEPSLWIRIWKEEKHKVFRVYADEIVIQARENPNYVSNTKDLWAYANKQWELIHTHDELLAMIEPIKEGFMLRNKIKWGQDYTFSELIQLENLFNRTLESNDISNPMQIDAIKKSAKMSISLDRAIMEGDTKSINDLSKAYQNFIKTAKIDEIITEASEDVISTVAELVDFIEKSGFKFNYYDNVDRDIVDKSITDIKQFIKRLVLDVSGAQLETVFESIDNALRVEKETLESAASYERVSLEDLYIDAVERRSEIVEEEFREEEEEELIFKEEDDDGYF